MAAETIYKLEPHRTLHLRGVDRFGAAGALWGTSASGFKLTGVFRDQADFAVVMLWDADDYFGHMQSSKYLPDFDFTGMVLSFDVHTSGVQPIDSPAFQWIPWRSVSYALKSGQQGSIDLQPHATYVSGTHTAAQAVVTISGSPSIGDRVTLWYQNIAFDYTVPGGPASSVSFPFTYPGGTHFTLGSCSYTTPGSSTTFTPGSTVAAGLAASGASDPNVLYSASGDVVNFSSRVNTGGTAGINSYTLWLITDPPATFIAAQLTSQINAVSWAGYSLPISASVSGADITITSTVVGEDGNSITLYAIFSGALSASPAVAPLSGGVSDATWSVSIDFSALGIDQLRQAWLTVAPKLTTDGSAYADTEWSVEVTNWSVSDPHGKRPLKIAGAGSVTVGSRDAWVSYSGASWAEEASNQPGGTGWFFRGFARRMSTPGDSVTIRYSCQSTHDLYLGTSLYVDRGIVSVTIDGIASGNLDGFLNGAIAPVVTRRWIASGVAAGIHTVTLTLLSSNHTALGLWDANSSGHYFYFDYVQAAVASDVPDPAATYGSVMPATDFDTDHGYRLSPQRLVWMLQRLGFGGQLDHYLGVFWWNQRKRAGAFSFPAATITFGGTWANGDTIFLTISGSTIGKTVFPADTADTIAAHFAYFVNETFTGVRASAAGAVLTITCRTPEFSFTLSSSYTSSAGTLSSSGSLSGGVEGDWEIDDTVTPVINRASTDWHTDFWATVAGAGLTGVASCSMELVNPPDGSGHVYSQKFSDGTPATTATGFGGLDSTQCTFGPTVLAYQKEAFKEMAGMMASAGLTPYLQFGEFVWWFFPGTSPSDTKGMAYYDADTAAAAVTALGRALTSFAHPTDDPSINGYADADFLRGLIYSHATAIATYVKATYAAAKFEALWPYDVNYPTPTAIGGLGGRLNRYVNLPSQWQAKSGSSLDRFKAEALSFGSTERSLALAKEAMAFSQTSPCSWALADTAYLTPIFNGGCPAGLEYLATERAGVPLVNLWAFDHLCLLSWPLPLAVEQPAAQVNGDQQQ